MNKFKQLLCTVMLAFAFTIPVMAENEWPKMVSDDLLGNGVTAVYLTNTLGAGNLRAFGAVPNLVGQAYTNQVGARVVVTASLYTNVNLLGTALLGSMRNADAWQAATNVGAATAWLSPATVSVTMNAGSGTVGPVTITLIPVWDGVTPDSSGANDWTFSLTPTASTTVTLSTNAPLWRWQGASAVMCARATNSTVAASSQVIITKLRFNHPMAP